MNIICIGTLDKVSRFYLGIEKYLEKESNLPVKFKIFSIYLSGFLYTLFRFKFSSWITLKSWLHAIKNKKKYLEVIENQEIYKKIPYKKLISFHLKLNKTSSKQNLLLQALAYIDIFDSVFMKTPPDLILLIGDSRLSIETCIALAKQYKVKTYFIEQGPFNTTVFNENGVNANAKINMDNTVFNKSNFDLLEYINKPTNPKYQRSIFYRGLDYILTSTFESSYIFPPDLKYTDTYNIFSNKQRNISSVNFNTDATRYLLILQIPMDVNMIYHSPNFKNHLDIVCTVHKSLPSNSQLFIREHPLFVGKYEKKLYKYIEAHQIIFDINPNLRDSLNFADVIIVNNSTVGVEAIALKKSVVVLGNAYYDHPGLCIKYSNKKKLKGLLTLSINFFPDSDYINKFFNEFISRYLVEGYITDRDLVAAKTIANRILLKNKIN